MAQAHGTSPPHVSGWRHGRRSGFELAPVPLVTTTSAGAVVGANAAARALLSAPEPVGRALGSFLAAEDRVRLEEQIAGLASGAAPARLQGRLDGSDRWVELSVAPQQGDAGSSALRWALLDATAAVLAERAESARRAEDRSALAAVADPVVIVDGSGTILRVVMGARAFGYDDAELVGRPLDAIVAFAPRRESCDAAPTVLPSPFGRDARVRREGTARHRDGFLRPVEVLLSPLGRDGRYALQIRDNTTVRAVAEALRAERDLAEQLIDIAHVLIVLVDLGGRVRRLNRFGQQLLGYAEEEVLDREWIELFVPPAERQTIREVMERAIHEAPNCGYRNVILTRTGEKRLIEWYDARLHDAAGRVQGLLGVGQDVTEHEHLERQVRQTHKLEALGRLAGGVAHDFNTLLSTIGGHAELLLDRTSRDDPRHMAAMQIHQGVERGTALTRQLLAFGRRRTADPTLLDVNAEVRDIETMLGRLVHGDIRVHHALDPSIEPVTMDRGQLGQILMNLIVNACDAMPGGGRLTIQTANTDVPQGGSIPPGRWVTLTVADTGCGMDEATLRRVFEPFFTTKAEGKGTGLGLALVDEIVRDVGGHVTVTSAVGCGTMFRVFLPPARRPQPALAPAPVHAPTRGTETVLLVEDDLGFRDLLREVLTESGYRVLSAAHPIEALELAARGGVDLVATDVTLPEMTGGELATRLVSAHPKVRIVFMSGHSERSVLGDAPIGRPATFLQKPFGMKAFARAVRLLLDEQG